MSRARALAALATLTLLAGCASLRDGPGGGREVSVEAEGWAPLDGDLLSAKHRALAEAQKKAVEKAVGLTVRARTRVEDAINVQESIEANLGGTIRRYEILSERTDGPFYKLRIRAVVLYRPKPADGAGLKTVRISVRLPNATVAQAIRTTLAAHEFTLAESDQHADVVITGVVETFGRADLRLGGFYSYRAQVSLNVLDARTGKVTEQSYEASALDVEEHSACDMALEQAGEISGERVADLLGSSPAPSRDGLVRQL